MYVYEVEFELMDDGDGPYWMARVPDFGGAVFDSGRTIAEACEGVAETLRLTIATYGDIGLELPEPTFHEPPRSVVGVELTEEFLEESKYESVTEAAADLGVSPSRVSQLLSSGQLEGGEFHGRRMVSIESVNRRLADKPAPHRPRKEAVPA